ncbi:uncharacterized protein LOC128393447 [Panonychus citri]|uniref:uncharacterized protein LOC128393447 n=1 Tax=Panonychus citri TaxID=50023 RepID=UPI002307B5E0|nr:uncharacterized protein LOC128393447 [Panonychus citri]
MNSSSSSSLSPPPPQPPSSSLSSESDDDVFMNYIRDFLNQRGPVTHKIDLIFSLIEMSHSLSDRKKFIVKKVSKYAMEQLINGRATQITHHLNSRIDSLIQQCGEIDDQFNQEAAKNAKLYAQNWSLKTALKILQDENQDN